MIQIKGLNKFYNSGKNNELHVLKNITLTLPDKGLVAVFGRSGCGKTTLLNVVGGLDDFASGQMLIDGHAPKEDINRTRNSDMGYIFQNYYLNYESNCFDNVADALRLCGIRDPAVLEERTLKALRLVGMEKYALRLPDTLSGGQQQRIAIARAIVKSPKIILADEPTGNLDEANTLMIMDLLKALSKDRLVLLVTHEAELVDHYCDRVVELYDGKIQCVRENKDANGLVAKKKNHIYLGELEKHTEEGAMTHVECYGDVPGEALRLRFIKKDGKTYLQVLTDGVQVIDENCEIKLFEGVFEEQGAQTKDVSSALSFDLPPVKGKNHGSLFTFGSSLLAGYRLHFSGMRKKGRRMLVVTMMLLSLILVMMVSSFGTAFADLKNINSSYNKNTFYLEIEQAEDYIALQNAVGEEASAIDFVFHSITGYSSPTLVISAFETGDFSTIDFSEGTEPILSEKLIKNHDLICGKRPENDGEVVISKVTAERILEKSTVSFIEEYRDLLYTQIANMDQNSASYTVVGIADTDEPAFYVNEKALAACAPFSGCFLPASDYRLSVKKGEATLYLPIDHHEENDLYPKIGDEILLNGLPLTLTKILLYPELAEENKIGFLPFELYDPVTSEYTLTYTPFQLQYLYNGAGFFVNKEDHIAACYTAGSTTPPMNVEFDPYEYTGITEDYAGDGTVTVLIHSAHPKTTKSYLTEQFSDLVAKDALTAPEQMKNMLTFFDGASIVSNFISMGIFSGIICICIYFIMRSSIMGRVKEIGIYRAIGVSKKNLVFRFFAEALSLSSLTVGVGTILTSALMFFWLDRSPLMEDLFFYPPWLALIVFLAAMGVSVLFGILPILFLLLKTPSEILAKYDI